MFRRQNLLFNFQFSIFNFQFLFFLLVLFAGCQTSVPTITPPLREGFLPADDGAKLYFKIVGDGPRTAVVPLVLWNQARFAREVPPGLRVVFYDPRGRQKSDPWTDSTATLGQALQDLDAVRRFLREEKISLIGTSFYGTMVARYAMLHPEHVDRVVMVGAIGPRKGIDANPAAMQARLDAAALQRLQERRKAGLDEVEYCREFWRIYAPVYVGRPENAHMVEINCDDRNELPAVLFPRFGTLMASLGEWNWTDEAKKLKVPVMVVHGTNDLRIPLEAAHEWARAFAEPQLVVIDKGGHLPWYDDADILFPQVMQFLLKEN